MVFAQGGYPVRFQGRRREALDAALMRIGANQDELVRHEFLTADEAEAALKQGLGFRWSVVGPFEHADLAGVDTHSATISFLFPLLSTDTDPPALFKDLVAKGRLGAKSGAGVYEYCPGEVERILAPRNAMLIDFIKVLKKHPPLRAPDPA